MFLKATTRHVHRRQDLVLDDLVEVLAGFLGHQKLGNEVAASRVAPVRAGHISDLYRLRSGRLGSGKRSEEHTSELQSLMRISYPVICLKKKNKTQHSNKHQ